MHDDDKKNPLAEYQTVTADEICDVLRITRRALERIIAGGRELSEGAVAARRSPLDAERCAGMDGPATAATG
jgi:hypothetical protein